MAPSPPLAVAGLALMGGGAGAYLAVDWAFMTDTVSRFATSGRYMGLANIANSIAGPFGLLIAGPLLDRRLRAQRPHRGGPARPGRRASSP